MRIKNLIFITFIKILIFSSISLASEKLWLCGNEIMQHIITNDKRNFEYNELRNDSGIHFSHIWNKENKIIIKRDQNNFPIINFSLFDNKNFIPNKTVIKKIGNKDLSKLNDETLNNLTYLKGKIDFELENGKIIKIESKPYKLNNFYLSNFEILSIQNIDTSKGILEMSFNAQFTKV